MRNTLQELESCRPLLDVCGNCRWQGRLLPINCDSESRRLNQDAAIRALEMPRIRMDHMARTQSIPRKCATVESDDTHAVAGLHFPWQSLTSLAD